MKIAPVSADLLIKIGFGVLLLGGAYLAVKGVKGSISETITSLQNSVTSAVDNVTGAPGRVLDWATTEAETRGAAIQQGITPQSEEMQDLTGRVYTNPLVNNGGMDFGQLSG